MELYFEEYSINMLQVLSFRIVVEFYKMANELET